MFQACSVPPGVRYRIGVNPSPPVAVVTACTGGVRAPDSCVASGPAAGLVARTAVTPEAGSVPVNVAPSVDHSGVHPGGACSEPAW
jgi:hypothetical protein